MSEKIVQLNEEVIKDQLKELVRGSVEETLNELLEQEAEQLTQAARYERNEARQGYRSGPVIMAETSPPHREMLRFTYQGSKVFPLKQPSLSGIAAERAV